MATDIHRRHFCGLLAGGTLAGFCPACFGQALTPLQEKRLGTLEHPNVIQEYGGVYDDPKVGGYFALVASRLVQAAGRVDIGFTFTLLNSPVVNAFALPGGYIYITRGLVALAEDEAQIAGVLGHEIGHVVARHTSKRIEAVQQAKRQAQIAGALGSVTGVQGLGQAAIGQAQRQLAGFSQDQEHEADVLGVRYMGKAGYDPDGLTSFLRNLRAHSRLRAVQAGRPPDSVDALDMLSSHPRTLDRVNRSIRLAKVARGGWQFDYRKQFLRNIDGMVFGDDPDQGVVRGRRFLHRGLGFAFQVPNGFSLENQPSEVIAEGPGGSGILFDQGSSRYQGSMRAYIVNVWGRNVTLRDLEPLTVNGMEAATGWTRVRGRGGSADIRVVAIRYDGSHIYRFMFVAPQGSMSRLAHGFKQTTYSFRRLGASEADSIRPWRIRILTLETDRSVRDLARRMAVNSHREDWFRVLNDVGNAQTVPAGRSVKLVV